MKYIGVLMVFVLMLSISACEDDPPPPVDSGTIVITVNSINESDIEPTGIVEKDENISNETGNPWGRFIDAAEASCGREPVGFRVLSATLSLVVDESSGVSTLDDVISGPATVFFIGTPGSDDEATRVDVATVSSVAGAGPIPMGDLASRSDLEELLERLEGGDFHVGLRAGTDLTRDDEFSMNVRIEFRARAYCE